MNDFEDLYQCGFTCGTFDVMHAGHILMLQEAKEQCKRLVVGLQTDPTIDRPSKNKPVESLVERYVKLRAIKWVDDIIPYTTEEDLTNIFKMFPFDVRIVGADYIGKDFTARQYCIDNRIDIYYNSRSHSYSSTDMRNRVYLSELAKHPEVKAKWIEP
jgi:glycerol-3-phosphate cytidylyltransferase